MRLLVRRRFVETVLKLVSCDCVHSLDGLLPAQLIEAIIAQVTHCKTNGLLSFSETNGLSSSDDTSWSSLLQEVAVCTGC